MASPPEDAPAIPSNPSVPQEVGNQLPRRSPPPPPRLETAADEIGGVRCGVLCFHLPRRSKKKKKKKPPPPVMQLAGGAAGIKSVQLETTATDDDDASSASPPPQRVTFLASASLSTWWPASLPLPPRPAGGASSSSFRTGAGRCRRPGAGSRARRRRGGAVRAHVVLLPFVAGVRVDLLHEHAEAGPRVSRRLASYCSISLHLVYCMSMYHVYVVPVPILFLLS